MDESDSENSDERPDATTVRLLHRSHAAGEPPPRHLTDLLGPVPARGATRDVWLAIAERAEHRLDAGLALPGTEHNLFARLAAAISNDPLPRGHALLAAADRLPAPLGPDNPERGQATLDAAVALHHTLEHQRSADVDLGVSL